MTFLHKNFLNNFPICTFVLFEGYQEGILFFSGDCEEPPKLFIGATQAVKTSLFGEDDSEGPIRDGEHQDLLAVRDDEVVANGEQAGGLDKPPFAGTERIGRIMEPAGKLESVGPVNTNPVPQGSLTIIRPRLGRRAKLSGHSRVFSPPRLEVLPVSSGTIFPTSSRWPRLKLNLTGPGRILSSEASL